MNLPRASVRRPVFTTMVTLMVIVLGAVSLSRLRTDLLPEIELPHLSVQTSYRGASPEVMESRVTRLVEEIVGTVPGVEEITSTSSSGSSRVGMRFAWGTDVDTAATEVRATLEDELNELPDDVTRPSLRKWDPNRFPVVLLGIASQLDPVELTALADHTLRRRFARLPGVAQVDPWGGYEREVRVEIDADRLRALALPLDAVLDAIESANLDLPAGSIERGQYRVTLRAPALFTDLDQLRDVVVVRRNGAAVRLRQIAEVVDTYAELWRHIRIDGELGLRLAIRKQADANTVEVGEAVAAEIERVNRDFPQIKVVAVINQGSFIERSIANVARSVGYGGLLAVLVLLFFLRNLRSTLVIALAIPISVVATFALLYFCGFTLNLMTLGGLALGVGMMVDSSIVVLENIYRRRDELSEDAPTAAVAGAVEVGTAILASTITTLVIFLPLIFVRGVSGVLFKELACVVVFSLVAALAVSLSLVPVLASKLLTSRDGEQADPSPAVLKDPDSATHKRTTLAISPPGKQPNAAAATSRAGDEKDAADAKGPLPHGRGSLTAIANRGFAALDRAYHDLLHAALRHRWITVGASLLALGLSLLLVPQLGTEFMPPSDEGEVRVSGEMDVSTRLDLVDQATRVMERVVTDAVPEARASVTSVSGNRGRIQMSLVPAAGRDRSNQQVADDLRERLAGVVPGMKVRVNAPQGQFLLERIVGGNHTGLTVEARGYDRDTLAALSDAAVAVLHRTSGVVDVDADRDVGVPQESLVVDRAKAADAGLTVRDVSRVLQAAVAGREAGRYAVEGASHRIFVQLKDAKRLSIDDVLALTLSAEGGAESRDRRTPARDIALRSLVTPTNGLGPTRIERKNGQRFLKVNAGVSGRDPGSVAQDVQAGLDGVPRPDGYELVVVGDFEEQAKAFNELLVSLGLALVLVYMVLACQYESLRDPLIVMCSVPLAAIGVPVTLFLTDTTLNVQTWIGCIMLGGIVVNNAILLVDQAGRLRTTDGFTVRDAVAEAGRRRLRPILMTTLTTVLGLAPLALGWGEGADAQAPLARAVIGGLTGSTLVTLVLIPVVYTLFHPEPDAGRDRGAA